MNRRGFLGALGAAVASLLGGWKLFKKKKLPTITLSEDYAFLLDTNYCRYTYHRGRDVEGPMKPGMILPRGPVEVIPDIRKTTTRS